MHQEVFKESVFKVIILPVTIATVMLGFYFVADDIPTWSLILLVVPAGLAFGGQSTKLFIEDDTLRYQSGLFIKKNEEVSLHDVTKIVTRVVETWDTNSDGETERSTAKITYVLDKTGKTFFSFSASLIRRGNRQRFKEILTAINPNIQIN